MMEWIIAIVLLFGSFFSLLTSISLVRLPDFYTRIQALTKASTFGLGLILTALILFFDDIVVTPKALLIVFFVFLTNPVSAHMLGRAAYFVGVPLWDETMIDELKGRYNLSTHELRGE